jgi:hypothetical protein
MGHWNLRVMQVTSDNELVYAIHEVYYDDDNVVTGWTENPVSPHGYFSEEDDINDEILDDIGRFVRATTMPVLDWVTGLEIS